MKIGIVVPAYINNDDHLYFTKQTIDTIKTSHEYEVVVVENRVAPEMWDKYFNAMSEFKNSDGSPITRIQNPENNVSMAWNRGIQHFFDKNITTVLVPNNDIVWHEKCIDNLVKFINYKPDFLMWTSNPYPSLRGLQSATFDESFDIHPGFSLFAITAQSVKKLKDIENKTHEPFPGMFDENYHGAYFEDQDYHQRILRAGFDAGKTASAIYYHFGSRTIKVDTELNDKNFETYENNRQYFRRKWGYDSHGKGFSNQERLEEGYKTAFDKGEKLND